MFFRLVLFGVLLSAAGATLAPAAETNGAWIDVPFFAQSKDGCGSAAIAMVMAYWSKKEGRPVPSSADPAVIQAALYSPKARGIKASDMQRYFQKSGYQVFVFNGDWQTLRHHLNLGRPLIVALQASGSLEPLHYVVVVGLDWERGSVFVNDPAQQKMLRISRSGFQSEWAPIHNWTLLAVPRTSD
ncbi:MAG TPA: C39 family peptidase [Verrucomicrobiae bacterium]|nr:C39 family peptidase [Verrucomicrobiae bacterium]